MLLSSIGSGPTFPTGAPAAFAATTPTDKAVGNGVEQHGVLAKGLATGSSQ